jgi:hypothetical protein
MMHGQHRTSGPSRMYCVRCASAARKTLGEGVMPRASRSSDRCGSRSVRTRSTADDSHIDRRGEDDHPLEWRSNGRGKRRWTSGVGRGHGLDGYEAAFPENSIDTDVLHDLREADLTQIGVTCDGGVASTGREPISVAIAMDDCRRAPPTHRPALSRAISSPRRTVSRTRSCRSLRRVR